MRGRDDFFEHMQIMRSVFAVWNIYGYPSRRVSRNSADRQASVMFSRTDQLEDGKIVDHRSLGDSLAVLQQLRGKDLV